ncbi:glycosyl transferase [Pochonia chlamydosporia 170]|uniref:Glycosyl transferase n=1 Tax=Pochonia chlamydosporia 170 TaxID=1380566 RepID=A0A179F569_METCM|nr:glycosyl transferase [Pochonia chlamydosporia 170]OAQ60576.1 glycosyl transferase [Pochonia chlamydosporia 170]
MASAYGSLHTCKPPSSQDAKPPVLYTTESEQNRNRRSAWKLIRNIVIVALMVIWVTHGTYSFAPTFRKCNTHKTKQETHAANAQIPNRMHYVKLLDNPGSVNELSFHFMEYLSVYAAWYYWRPDTIYLHTNAVHDTISGARDGFAGKWAKLILQIPNIKILRVTVPSVAGYTLSRNLQTEVVAAAAVRDLGGVYSAFDVHALQDIQAYRHSGFPSVLAASGDTGVSHDFFMSKRDAMLVTAWEDRLEQAYALGAGSIGETILPGVVGSIMRIAPQELRLMDTMSFVTDQDNSTMSNMLYHVPETGAEDSSKKQPDSGNLKQIEFEFIDWSNTHLVQLTDPQDRKWTGNRSEYVTPRHILDRRSNFARALYPIAKILHDKGLLQLDEEFY